MPFGETTADFLVDRNVLTLQPLEARDGGGRLVASGQIAWGGALGGEYRLTGFATETERWPVERVFSFLSLDLPITGLVTGRLPLDGVTPRVVGEGSLVFEGTRLWGQPFDRVEGTLGFESDRLRLSAVRGVLGSGTARLDGFYRYDDDGFEVEAEALKPARGEARGARRRGARPDGPPHGLAHRPGNARRPGPRPEGGDRGGGVEGEASRPSGPGSDAPPGARGRRPRSRSRRSGCGAPHRDRNRRQPFGVGLEVRSIAAYSALLGFPPETELDGTAALEADLSRDSEGNVTSARGRFLSLEAVRRSAQRFPPGPGVRSRGRTAGSRGRTSASRRTGPRVPPDRFRRESWP